MAPDFISICGVFKQHFRPGGHPNKKETGVLVVPFRG